MVQARKEGRRGANMSKATFKNRIAATLLFDICRPSLNHSVSAALTALAESVVGLSPPNSHHSWLTSENIYSGSKGAQKLVL